MPKTMAKYLIYPPPYFIILFYGRMTMAFTRKHCAKIMFARIASPAIRLMAYASPSCCVVHFEHLYPQRHFHISGNSSTGSSFRVSNSKTCPQIGHFFIGTMGALSMQASLQDQFPCLSQITLVSPNESHVLTQSQLILSSSSCKPDGEASMR